MLDQTEQQDSLEEEQAIMDDQKDKVAELVKHIPELGIKSPFTLDLLTSDTKPSHHLHRWLNDVESNLHLVHEEF